MKVGMFGVGFAIGLGTGLVVREVLPIFREIASPITKVAIKVVIKFFERSREGLMRAGEMVEDTVAEIQEELQSEKRTKSGDRVTKIRKKERRSSSAVPEGEASGLREVV